MKSILLMSAVYIHYKPVVNLAILALTFKSVFYILQGVVFKTIPLTAGLQVPSGSHETFAILRNKTRRILPNQIVYPEKSHTTVTFNIKV